jgi:hypothetical protein
LLFFRAAAHDGVVGVNVKKTIERVFFGVNERGKQSGSGVKPK